MSEENLKKKILKFLFNLLNIIFIILMLVLAFISIFKQEWFELFIEWLKIQINWLWYWKYFQVALLKLFLCFELLFLDKIFWWLFEVFLVHFEKRILFMLESWLHFEQFFEIMFDIYFEKNTEIVFLKNTEIGLELERLK